MVDESWRMLEWATTTGGLSRRSKTDGKERTIVGFAIWRLRVGEKVKASEAVGKKKGWIATSRSKGISFFNEFQASMPQSPTFK